MNNESYSGGDLHNIIGRVAVYAQVGLVMLFGSISSGPLWGA